MQRHIRRYILSVAVLIAAWLVLREIKFRFVIDLNLERHLWYAYYIPILLTPLAALFVAILLGKSESNRLPGTYIPAATGDGATLIYEFAEDDATYIVDIPLSSDDVIASFDGDDPTAVFIENEAGNYCLDLYVNADSKDAYDGFVESAKENDVFAEYKYGSFDGCYAGDSAEIFGYMVLDAESSDFVKFLMIDLYPLNDGEADAEALFNSEGVQNILNNIRFSTK